MNYCVLLILRRYFNRFQIFKFFIVLLLIMLLVNLYVFKPPLPDLSERDVQNTRAVFAYHSAHTCSICISPNKIKSPDIWHLMSCVISKPIS